MFVHWFWAILFQLPPAGFHLWSTYFSTLRPSSPCEQIDTPIFLEMLFRLLSHVEISNKPNKINWPSGQKSERMQIYVFYLFFLCMKLILSWTRVSPVGIVWLTEVSVSLCYVCYKMEIYLTQLFMSLKYTGLKMLSEFAFKLVNSAIYFMPMKKLLNYITIFISHYTYIIYVYVQRCLETCVKLLFICQLDVSIYLRFIYKKNIKILVISLN